MFVNGRPEDKPLIASDPMPFGKYKGKRMDQVEPGYLLWCYEQDWMPKFARVMNYIAQNQEELEAQRRDERGW